MSFFSNFILALKFAKEIMFNFKEATKEQATVGESLYYLFLISLIPALITSTLLLMLSDIAPASTQIQNLSPVLRLLDLSDTSFRPVLFVVSMFLILLSIVLVGAILGSAVLHFFGKILRLLKMDFKNTVAAVVFGSTPAVLFSWIPYIFPFFFSGPSSSDLTALLFSSLLLVVANLGISVWSLLVQIYALSNQHQIGKWRAVGAIFIPAIIITVIVAVIAYTFINS